MNIYIYMGVDKGLIGVPRTVRKYSAPRTISFTKVFPMVHVVYVAAATRPLRDALSASQRASEHLTYVNICMNVCVHVCMYACIYVCVCVAILEIDTHPRCNMLNAT